ncbi:MAG: hypothetical protein ACRDK3_13310 [Actinomycetota bacterium]
MGDEARTQPRDSGTEPARRSLGPLRAFVAAVALALVGVAVVAAMSPNHPAGETSPRPSVRENTTPAPAAEDHAGDPEVDGARAKAIFAELRRGLETAYKERDLAALREVVDPGSPQFVQSRNDLRLLEKNNLLDRTQTRAVSVTVVSIEPARLVVRERAAVRPRYLDDVTYVEAEVALARTRATSEWTIERREAGWVIVSSRVTG